jgi:hypothetical protein
MNEAITKKHCCPNLSGAAKFIMSLFIISLVIGIFQDSISTENAKESKKIAILSYANKLGLSKDISANFKCINNQAHYLTGASVFGSNYSLLQPIVTCDSEYYETSTSFKPSDSILKLSGLFLVFGLILSLIRLKIDPELRAYQERNAAKKEK